MKGYLNQPEATRQVLRDGWLDTGDLGFLHEGELYLKGRAKDLIVLRGRNHAPEEIELPVNELAAVRTGCVAAVSHLPEGWEREQVLLLVEKSRRATSAQIASLPGACRGRVLGRTGITLDRVVVLAPGTLPRTSSGKIRRQETLRRYLEGELKPPDRIPAVALARTMGRSVMAFVRLRQES